MVIIRNAGINWKEGTIMGMRFRKSFKVAPGVKINLNSSSASVSVGGKHLRTTVNTKGQKTTSVGTPIVKRSRLTRVHPHNSLIFLNQ